VNGSIVVNQRNFDILRVPTSLDDLLGGRAFRGGGQELRLEAMPGTIFQRYSVTLREPYLFDSRFGGTASGYYYNRAFAEYNEDRYGGRFSLDYRFLDNNIWRATATTRIEGVNIHGIPWYATDAIRRDEGQSTLLGLRAGLNRDTRDSYLLPTSGSVIDVGFEQVLGSYTFPIGSVEASSFWTVWQRKDGSGKQVLAARSQLSVAGSDAPVFERFYAGGFRSLRGFTFRGVGPFENTLNVGGTFAFLNTLEYQLPILANDKLWFVTFVDHGTVERNVSIRDYRVSVGAGLRIVVPAMGPLPIALDFAFPLNKAPWDNKQVFSFYVGWFGGQ
jgi:outer membrane protein assembly factor BamA